MFSTRQFPEKRLPETFVLQDNLIRLVQNVKQNLNLSEVGVLCRLVECLVTTIVLHEKEIDLEGDTTDLLQEADIGEKLQITSFQSQDIRKKMLNTLKDLRLILFDFITRRFVSLGSCTAFEWEQELQVGAYIV